MDTKLRYLLDMKSELCHTDNLISESEVEGELWARGLSLQIISAFLAFIAEAQGSEHG